MIQRSLVLCLGFVTFQGVSGCKSEEPPPPVSKDQFATSVAKAICDNIEGCCTTKGFTFVAAGCTSNASSLFSQRLAQAGLKFDDQKAGECVAYLKEHASSCAGAMAGSPCDEVFVGTTPVGGDCVVDGDCAKADGKVVLCSSDTFDPDTGAAQGKCTTRARAQSGAACSGTCFTNDDGELACVANFSAGDAAAAQADCYVGDGVFCAADGKCKALVAENGSCDSNAAFAGCATDHMCDYATSTCVGRHTASGSCRVNTDCAPGLFCSPAGTCGDIKPVGASCTGAIECSTLICENGICAEPTIANTMVCTGSCPSCSATP